MNAFEAFTFFPFFEPRLSFLLLETFIKCLVIFIVLFKLAKKNRIVSQNDLELKQATSQFNLIWQFTCMQMK